MGNTTGRRTKRRRLGDPGKIWKRSGENVHLELEAPDDVSPFWMLRVMKFDPETGALFDEMFLFDINDSRNARRWFDTIRDEEDILALIQQSARRP